MPARTCCVVVVQRHHLYRGRTGVSTALFATAAHRGEAAGRSGSEEGTFRSPQGHTGVGPGCGSAGSTSSTPTRRSSAGGRARVRGPGTVPGADPEDCSITWQTDEDPTKGAFHDSSVRVLPGDRGCVVRPRLLPREPRAPGRALLGSPPAPRSTRVSTVPTWPRSISRSTRSTRCSRRWPPRARPTCWPTSPITRNCSRPADERDRRLRLEGGPPCC